MDIKQSSVTCVCITKRRHSHLLRSVDMFWRQTYKNKKLLIICDHDDVESIAIAKASGAETYILPSNINYSLGEIRSIAKSLTTTEYFCQWDDDDWFHCNRLEIQMDQLQQYGQSGCVLTNWIIYDEATRNSYLSMHRLWEGSSIYSVERAKTIQFPSQGLVEDTVLLNEYVKSYGILPVTSPYLYIYRIHSDNTWGTKKSHFNMMLAQSQLLPKKICDSIHSLIDSPKDYADLCDILMDKKTLSNLHFFKFNNLNYTNEQILEYMVKIDHFDETNFNTKCFV